MHHARHRRGLTVAFVAAGVLVLQFLFSAWATSAIAATPLLDRFGNPLCITSIDHGGALPAGNHSNLPDCCAFGCSLTSPLLGTGPADPTGLFRPLSCADARFDLFRAIHIEGPDHVPGSPRAPPVA